MAHPLENYRSIAEPNFISRKENTFYTEYALSLSKGLYVDIDKENSRLLVSGHDMYTNDSFSDSISFSSYFIDEYNKLEKEVRLRIDEIILSHLDEKKQEIFVKGIIAELQLLQNAIEKNTLPVKFELYKPILLDKIFHLIQTLNEVYLNPKKSFIPKIQWLGKTNVLTTLLYDLWQGQEKGKENATKPLIKAQKKDLEILLLNYFIDAKGKPLTESTVSDYLNASKPETRAKKGIRIELEY